MTVSSMDEAVTQALGAVRSAGTPDPDLLLFPATGTTGLIEALESGVKLEFADVAGAPDAYRDLALYAGSLGSSSVWIIEDAPNGRAGDAAWTRAFPVWLAAAAGARFLIHTSAGTALDEEVTRPESIVRATDHINLSGTTPLLGLGKSRFGPLFPDQTRVHDEKLAELARSVAQSEGIELQAAVVACTIGPALSTPAEMGSYRLAGAGIAVQRLSDPLIASAHAGLGVLSLTAITDLASEQLGIADMVLRASRVAPSLDRLVTRIAAEAGALVAVRREETPA
ncbi:Purine nucleoside phosphorylase 1 [Planctomycetes bacterium Poly30]|uniref:purine-nucleoside phosphorylase n=1 Tax=Saltatorellus ferox TaxID=2528018 RepID=A0A518ETQ0_9BACT|nr:Purine nucleoside phosphorylase 1 [Planctomycetes bacterium Poly30]